MAVATMLVACSTDKPVYSSVDDYPVKKGSVKEMNYSPKSTKFSVWSPNADAVYLNLYADCVTEEAIERLPMERKRDGSWELTVHRDLDGTFYTFSVTEAASQWRMHETPGIFAQALGVNGQRAAVIDMKKSNPTGWDKDVRPAFADRKDAIIYEMHHRDFSIDPSAGNPHAGKFLALTAEGTMSPEGLKTGIDHLKELGVTHVQILPSYDFGSIDESGLASEARVLESGAAVGGQYNWGYDPQNYNAPDGSYSSNPYDPYCRIQEMKSMILALHQAGIRVVMDVVYNHTYNVEDAGFTQTAPGYFYRTTEDGELGNASGCGNETASNRPMMRKFIVESAKYWVEEYHVDGFRFDLMGIHDMETMNEVRRMLDRIDPTLLLYGEGWTAGSAQYPTELLALKANVKNMPGVGAFCDDMRDALRGPFSDDHQGAFLAGLPGNEQSIRFGIVGCIDHPGVDMSKVNYSKEAWTAEPTQCISYVSCHDDMMLTDRLMASVPDMTADEFYRLDKLAQTAVLTSQGLPFLWNGEEIMRNKKGVHNSFCSPDSINAINWSLKAQNIDVFNYYKGLIALRRAHPAFRMGAAAEVVEHLEFLSTDDLVVAFRLKNNAGGDEWNDIVVVLNAQREETTVALPQEGTYTAVVANGKVNEAGLGAFEKEVVVAAQSAIILHN